MRSIVRKCFTWLFVACIGGMAVAVLGEFFIKVAEDKGYYKDAAQNWDRAMSTIYSIVTSEFVLYPVTFLGGLVAGLWLDCLLKPNGAPVLKTSQSEISGSSWANGAKFLTVRQAACALASVTPDLFKTSAPAQAFESTIIALVVSGWIQTENEYDPNQGSMRIVFVGMPRYTKKKSESVTPDTRILCDDLDNIENGDHSWVQYSSRTTVVSIAAKH